MTLCQLPWQKDYENLRFKLKWSGEGFEIIEKLQSNTPGLTTVWEWTKNLGWIYINIRKNFYVDGNERPKKKQHMKEIRQKDLTQWDRRSHRWVQIYEDKF